MTRITEAQKIREGRGTGFGATYKPWIKIREINSLGTASAVIDYKTGRAVQLLSQAEVYYYYLLRWNDDVLDIREQFPLELERSVAIAEKLGFRHPRNKHTHMTTDLLVTHTDGRLEAYCIKVSPDTLNDERTRQKLTIEKLYWETQGVPFQFRTKDEVNEIFVRNIMDVVSCYDIDYVQTPYDFVRHRIAHKILKPDMQTSRLDYSQLVNLL